MDTQTIPAPTPVGIPVAPSVPVPPPNYAPAASYVYAGFGRRLVAAFVDSFLVGAITGGLTVGLGIAGKVSSDSTVSAALSGIGTLIQLAISVGYYVFFTGSSGQTIGKKLLGIRVVGKATGESIGFVSALLREPLGKFVSSLIFCLGYLWVIWDKDKQAWHDKIANSVVIRV